MDAKVGELATNGRLSEVQRGYPHQLEVAEAKGESGTIEVLGVSRTLADCLASLVHEDETRPAAEKRLPEWTMSDISERVVRPAANLGIELMRKIEEAAARGQPYFKFQGGLDATASTLSQTRRFEKELLVAHPLPPEAGEEDPLATVEALYKRAIPPLEELSNKVAEERKRRWASLGPGMRP
jgi:hypothetical protein